MASISAQPDNLGDIEIRRQALKHAAQNTHQQIFWAGNMPDSYVYAFDLPDGSLVFRRPISFVGATLKALTLNRLRLVIAPGPAVLIDSMPRLFKQLALTAFATSVRLGGGHVISIGRAFTGRSKISRRLEYLLSRLCLHYSVRDSGSEASLGFPVLRVPDVGFSRPIFGLGSEGRRGATAVSLRNDSDLSLPRMDSFIRKLRIKGLEPIFVTQVRRDDELHVALAKRYGAEVVRWEGADHNAQFDLVDATLSQCKYIASNRLHSLVFGLTRGAIPVELRLGSSRKIVETLGHLGVLGETAWLGKTDGSGVENGSVLWQSGFINDGPTEIVKTIQDQVLATLSMVASAGTNTVDSSSKLLSGDGPE